MTRGPRRSSIPRASTGRATDAGGPAIAGIATALGAAAGALLASRIGYLYADSALVGQELEAAALIVFGGFAGGIALGAGACWLALRIGRRPSAGETAWRTLALLLMLAPILLFGTPALDITPLAGLGLGCVAAGAAGAAARLLTPGRGTNAPSRRMP